MPPANWLAQVEKWREILTCRKRARSPQAQNDRRLQQVPEEGSGSVGRYTRHVQTRGSNRVPVRDCRQTFLFQSFRERDLRGLATNIICSSGGLRPEFRELRFPRSSNCFWRIVVVSLTTSVDVKAHVLRAGRRSRLSSAKSRRRRPSLCRRSSRCPHAALDPCHCITTVSAPNISSVTCGP